MTTDKKRDYRRDVLLVMIACDTLATMLENAYGFRKENYIDDALEGAAQVVDKIPADFTERLINKALAKNGGVVEVNAHD